MSAERWKPIALGAVLIVLAAVILFQGYQIAQMSERLDTLVETREEPEPAPETVSERYTPPVTSSTTHAGGSGPTRVSPRRPHAGRRPLSHHNRGS